MKDFRTRSINSQLTRFSIAALVVLAVALSATGWAIHRAVGRWEAMLTGSLSVGVTRLFERQADETSRLLDETSRSGLAVAVLQSRPAAAARRAFTAEVASRGAQYGYSFVLIAGARRDTAFTWARATAPNAAPVLPDALFDRIDAVGAVSGYVRSGNDVWLVAGKSLHSGRDSAAAGGYLLLGQLLDRPFLGELGRNLTATLSVSATPPPTLAPTFATNAPGDSLFVRLPLDGVLGTAAGTVEAAFQQRASRQLLTWGLSFVLLTLVLAAAGLAVAWSATRRLLVEPLRAMASEVEAMRQSRALREISGDAPATEWAVLRSTFNETVRTLHDWQQRYRDVFDRAADALFLIEQSTGRVIDANPATAALTGIAPEAMIGQPLPPDLLPAGVGQRVVRWRRPDGVTQTWGVAASALVLDSGPATLAAYRDLTGREEMAHAQKMEAVGSLAGGIAHDFNNLLGTVLTGSLAARALLPEGHAALAALDGIEHAGTRAAELTQQLLRFSRHDPLRLAPIDLGQAIETVGVICSRTFDRRIAVDAWAPTGLPAVLGDAGEIEQALLNLCINARDAMPEGGSLRIEARREVFDAHQARAAGVLQPGVYVVVAVADTGAGMTDDVKARLFEPFFTTKETGKGTGLGLSLVYGLMRQLGGAITVRSVVQRGTRVTLLFPALALQPDRPETAPVTPTSTARQRRTPPTGVGRPLILLIDDEHALREMLRLVLDVSGFEVIEAADGASGVARLMERNADVRAILLDVQLPGELSGPETLEQIRAINADVPVLLCTGFVREDDLARMRMLTVDDVLLKPVDVNALLARLDALSRVPRVPTAGVPS